YRDRSIEERPPGGTHLRARDVWWSLARLWNQHRVLRDRSGRPIGHRGDALPNWVYHHQPARSRPDHRLLRAGATGIYPSAYDLRTTLSRVFLGLAREFGRSRAVRPDDLDRANAYRHDR